MNKPTPTKYWDYNECISYLSEKHTGKREHERLILLLIGKKRGITAMGTRIHVVLGYGWESFDDETLPEEFDNINYLPEMVRISEEKKKATENDNSDPDRFNCRFFLRHIREQNTTSLNSYDFVKFNFHDDSPHPIILTSPLNKDWYRYDDIIDYVLAKDSKDSIFLLKTPNGVPRAIYPYIGLVNKHTKERLRNIEYSDTWDGEERFKLYSGGLTFADLTVPIPYEIRLFCEVSKFPLDPYTAHPMVYTYWS